MSRFSQKPPGTLYVVGTPIGNLEDMSARARNVLERVAAVAAEDTRRAQRLLSSSGISANLVAYHDHNEERATHRLIAVLREGGDVALVSDAGMPLISDPGWALVSAARAHGFTVVSVPGPCAVSAALSVAGMPTNRFCFEGFLSRRAGPRRQRLVALRVEQRTMVFFESVHRLGATLEDMAGVFGEARPAALARELTKVHETTIAATLGELSSKLGNEIPLLGEFVIIVAGASEPVAPDEGDAARIYSLLSEALPPAKAVSLTAKITGLARNAVYRLARVPDTE